MLSLSLDWQHCPDGVELHDYGKPKPAKKGVTRLGDPPSSQWFRYRSSKRFFTRHTVDNLEDLLVVRFVNARDDASRTEFFGRFGFPFTIAAEAGEMPRSDVVTFQEVLRRWLGIAAGEQSAAQLRNINEALSSVGLEPQLRREDGGAVRLTFYSTSLHGFMVAEIAMVAMYGAKLSACQHCGTEFLTGHMTGRRDSAKFCADKCRVAASRARNAAES